MPEIDSNPFVPATHINGLRNVVTRHTTTQRTCGLTASRNVHYQVPPVGNGIDK